MPEVATAAPPSSPSPAPSSAPAPRSDPAGASPPQFATLPETGGVKSTHGDPVLPESINKLRSLGNKGNKGEKKQDKPAAKAPEKPVEKDKPKAEARPEEKSEAKPEAESEGLYPDLEQGEATERGQAKTEAKPEAKPESKAKPLRDAYESLKKKYSTLESTHKELESKITEHPKVKGVFEENQKLKARLQEYDSEMLYTNAEKSEQFQREHYQPYVQNYQDAYTTLSEWSIPVEGGAPRALTPQEFQKIVATGSGREALEVARSIYGEEGIEPGVVFAARQAVMEASRRFQRAKDEIKQTASQRQQQTLEQSRQEADLWRKFTSEDVEKYPQWFKAPDGDEKAKELLEKGFKFVDEAFDGASQKWEPQKRARRLAVIRNKAAGFDRLAYDNSKLRTRLKELETKLGEFEESEPKGGEPESSANGKKSESTSPLRDWMAKR